MQLLALCFRGLRFINFDQQRNEFSIVFDIFTESALRSVCLSVMYRTPDKWHPIFFLYCCYYLHWSRYVVSPWLRTCSVWPLTPYIACVKRPTVQADMCSTHKLYWSVSLHVLSDPSTPNLAYVNRQSVSQNLCKTQVEKSWTLVLLSPSSSPCFSF